MARPLSLADAPPGRAAADWDDFVRRRDALVARMEMATCNGCDGCGQRCTAGFKVTRAEHEAVRRYLADVPATEVMRVLGQRKTVPWPGAEEEDVTFTFCRFRDTENGNCFIYPVRPTVCRLFGHTPWLPCPIGAVTRIPEGTREIWNEYYRQERKTWEEWDARDAENC